LIGIGKNASVASSLDHVDDLPGSAYRPYLNHLGRT